MTRSHAKNNTTQSTLTYYERSLLRKDNAAKRLGTDSFKPIDNCNLCLTNVRLRDPVACSRGHVYCKECAISNLISQKAGIESSKREMDRWEETELREREDARARARERVVMDFEKGMGLGMGGPSSSAGRKAIEQSSAARINATSARPGDGVKLDLNGDHVERLAREAEEKALRMIELEQAEARKHKLAAFWLPSLAPEAKLGPLKDVKLQTLCHVGGEGHPLSRKSLLPVLFTYPPASNTSNPNPSQPTPKPICPSCHRDLSNSTTPILLSSKSPAVSANGVGAGAEQANGNEDEDGRPRKKTKKDKKDKDDPFVCGHVICKTCADTIVKPSGRCCVCEAGVKGGDSEGGIIPLGKEGTGFAAAGGVEVKKNTLVFRV